MKTCCIVVIGHVDHGKTSLVRALTGIDTDRLPEEKRRGLSIAPGFAHRTYSGGTIDFVDAPGHEDFIQAMIASATGASAALVVISASEGIGAQTLEHLRIAGLLGITQGIIAVTKSDLLEPLEQAACLDEIRAALRQTPLGGAPLILCSAQTGHGMGALIDALETMFTRTANTPAPLDSFLPIDRVFSLPGRGTVVTGTLLGQDLAVGDSITLHPDGPAITIRSLQSRGVERDHIQVGERMAANLRGVGVTDIARGAVLCAKDACAASACIDVQLELLPAATRALKHMQDLRVLFGTSSEVAQVRLFGGGRIAAGQSGFAQLRFKNPVVGFAGQRAILRCLSPPETIAGAVFLDPQATAAKSGNKARLRLLEAARLQGVVAIANALCVANHGVCSISDVARISRMTQAAVLTALDDAFESLDTDLLCPTEEISTCKADVLAALATFHATYPLKRMAPRVITAPPTRSPILQAHVETALLASRDIRRHDTMLAVYDHDPMALLSDAQHMRMADIEGTFSQAALAPPTLETLPQTKDDDDLVQLLMDTGRLIRLHNVSLNQTLVFHADTLSATVTALHAAFPAPLSFTTGEARSLLITSRRIIVPVLEHFDSLDVTLRKGDARQMAALNSVSPVPPPR